MSSISCTTVVIMQDCSIMQDRIIRLVCNSVRLVVCAGIFFVYAFIELKFLGMVEAFFVKQTCRRMVHGVVVALFFFISLYLNTKYRDI